MGTPEPVADAMVYLLEEGGGDGFQISPPYYGPDYYADLVDLLVPVLRKRGLYRDDYSDNTLREYLA